jgi:hypothetical protein
MEYSEDSIDQDWSIGPKKIICTGNFTQDLETMKQRDLELLKERRKKMNHIYGSEKILKK